MLPTSPPPPGPPLDGRPPWPTEPAKPDEPARVRSQVAVFVVAALAIGIACGAGGVPEWGVAGVLALGAGVAIGLALDVRRPFQSMPGAVGAAIAMMVALFALLVTGGPPAAYGFVPLVGAFVLGLDWHLVRRLRPLPFAFGFLVVVGVASGDPWTLPAAVVWMACALGALTSLESDRRAAQPKVQAVTAGPSAPDVQTTDVVTSVLIALAIALVAALVLSTPSCHRNDGGANGRSSGSGSEFGSGSEPGSGSGSGGRYVPDPDGRFLVPGNGSGSPSDGFPSPELLPGRGEGSRTLQLDDGTIIVAERNPDGTGRIVVTDPDGTTRRYEYRPRSDGTTEVQEFDDQGRPGRTLLYDPDGQIATDDGASPTGSGTDPQQPDQPDQEQRDRSGFDWRLAAIVLAVLAAAAGAAWWWTRRAPKAPPADAPPWALRLAREIEHEGAARGPRRGRSQSLARYADALRAGPLPDDRLPVVADVVSTALFGREVSGAETQAWAESTWAAILADHPAPGRAERRRARAGSAS